MLLTETMGVSGFGVGLSRALASWRKPLAMHDPAKVLTDLAVTLSLGGDCLADIAVLREHPVVYGCVASDPTVSRTIAALAKDAPAALAAIDTARAQARARVWRLAGQQAPDHGVTVDNPLIIDVDATLVTAHSEKENAAPTFKRGYGFHPLWAFVDHGAAGSGEPLACLLRAGNAGSNTAADHISVVGQALKQLPGDPAARPAETVLIRTDAAGATHDFLNWLVAQRLSYSLGFTLPTDFADTLARIPADAWTPAYDAERLPREGAWVADVTDLLQLSSWPAGMRVIIRKERPHPGAQLRITDVDGHRITAFATNTGRGQLADLELRHRRRARAEDRIRCAKDTGLTNLPLHSFAQNQLWCAIVAIACEATVWMQLLAFPEHQARRWEPKRLRLRLFNIAGRSVRTGRRVMIRVAKHGPWTDLLLDGIGRLHQLAAPG